MKTVSLRSLVLCSGRTVNFPERDKKNIAEARAVFIQKALVENELGNVPPFLRDNLEIIHTWQAAEDRLRKRDIVIHEESIYAFYDRNLPASVYDRNTLTRYLKKNGGGRLS